MLFSVEGDPVTESTFSSAELMIVNAARLLCDGDIVFVGVGQMQFCLDHIFDKSLVESMQNKEELGFQQAFDLAGTQMQDLSRFFLAHPLF